MTDAKTSTANLKTIMEDLLDRAGPGKSIHPTDVARAAGGDPNRVPEWRRLLRGVSGVALSMQDAGELVALRKGKPVELRTTKGVIRFARPNAGGDQSSQATSV